MGILNCQDSRLVACWEGRYPLYEKPRAAKAYGANHTAEHGQVNRGVIVDGHRNNLLEKTGARNTAGLVFYAIRHGLVTFDV